MVEPPGAAGASAVRIASISAWAVTKLKKRMSSLRVGDPLDKSVDIGALVSTLTSPTGRAGDRLPY